jgi:hypothetical protein
MGKQRRSRTDSSSRVERPAVTADRFMRLYLLVQLLGKGPLNREVLARRLSVDVRGFYRDLDLLRKAGVSVALLDGRYALSENVAVALARLPFPDPHLSLGDARVLAKGRTKSHQQLKAQIGEIVPR